MTTPIHHPLHLNLYPSRPLPESSAAEGQEEGMRKGEIFRLEGGQMLLRAGLTFEQSTLLIISRRWGHGQGETGPSRSFVPWVSQAQALQLEPVEPAAGVAGDQQGAGGVHDQGGDGGIGDEQHLRASIGAGRIPEADRAIV